MTGLCVSVPLSAPELAAKVVLKALLSVLCRAFLCQLQWPIPHAKAKRAVESSFTWRSETLYRRQEKQRIAFTWTTMQVPFFFFSYHLASFPRLSLRFFFSLSLSLPFFETKRLRSKISIASWLALSIFNFVFCNSWIPKFHETD